MKKRLQKEKCPNNPYGAFLFKNRDRFPVAWRTYQSEELRSRQFHQEPRLIGQGGLS